MRTLLPLLPLLPLLALLALVGCSRPEPVPVAQRVVEPVRFEDVPVEDISLHFHRCHGIDVVNAVGKHGRPVTIVAESMTVAAILYEIRRQTGLFADVVDGTVYIGAARPRHSSVRLIDPAAVRHEGTRKRLEALLSVCSPGDMPLADMRDFVTRVGGLEVRYRGTDEPDIEGGFIFNDAPLHRVLNWWAVSTGLDLEVAPGVVTFVQETE